MKTNAIELSVTPAFGGRVLSFNLRGQPNVLKLGAAVDVSADVKLTHSAEVKV
ncbi:DUF4380 domain-containing protein, partial [Xanthomonas citri]|uniref:DUF4380 domain-containing protein n=1 Tax=Xanthomonas citri TaxID=346 RepID=UPI003F6DBD52